MAWAGSRGRSHHAVAAAACLLLVFAAAAAAEPSREECLACHGDPGITRSSGEALDPVVATSYAASNHGALSCTTCHVDVTAPHPARLAPVGLELCEACHTKVVEEYRASVHGAMEGSPTVASCATCHGDVHVAGPHTDARSPVQRGALAATCGRCHADRDLVERYRIPVARPVEAYLQSAHARAVVAGKGGAVCSDCHGAHAIMRGTDPRSSIFRTNVPGTCGACHAGILETYRASVHGEALARGVSASPVCTDCHGEHRILGTAEPESPVFAANIPGETCGRCHGDLRLSEKYGLPTSSVSAFKDSFHGLALRLGRITVANCSSCHGVHDIRPSSDPLSHVHQTNLAATCGKCHPGAGTRFELGPVHAEATSAGGRVVAWVRLVYLWLIGVTIGGMLLHDLLDLVRKARTPLPQPPLRPGGERMSRALRWQHGLVMVSFPILVYTGFALTYPEQWWATPFLGWEERFGLRGLMHRVGALVLIAALAWHAVHVATSPLLRRCLRGLLPSRHDFRVLLGTLAYYVGRRPHPPRAGTFHYAEKVEYWAFLWGTMVMTVSGLLLWFENSTLSLLPGWVPAVATAVHFYEAVLATLAILVWHFYWVIFDPAIYPMDTTWWTGRSPAARAAERGVAEDGQVAPAAGGDQQPSR